MTELIVVMMPNSVFGKCALLGPPSSWNRMWNIEMIKLVWYVTSHYYMMGPLVFFYLSLSDIFFVLEMIALLQCLFFPSILISQFNLFLLLLKDLISFFNFFKWFNLSFIFLKVSKGWVWFHYKSKFMCCVKKFDSIFFRIFLFI